LSKVEPLSCALDISYLKWDSNMFRYSSCFSYSSVSMGIIYACLLAFCKFYLRREAFAEVLEGMDCEGYMADNSELRMNDLRFPSLGCI
jgi:predicted permease